MECWGVREYMRAVEPFIQTGSIIDTQRRFCHDVNQQEAPAPNAYC